MDNQFHVSHQARSKSAEANSPATEAQMQGTRNLVWLLIAVLVCILIVIAMWARFSYNHGSIENPGNAIHSAQPQQAQPQ